jgi:NADH-quinone oxidoreductase subunit L
MGLLGLVQNDIKRVVAYSTLSQLGYMAVALGASAYAAAIFHLVTHAFFKALLFLAAGSVIIALHHNQDMRSMGGLRKYMPVTWITSLLGSLALIGFPGFAGFFSKDAIIEAVHLSEVPGHDFAYWCVVIGVFVTALYSFRLYFLVFHGKERMDEHAREHLHESPWVVTVPLVLLAIPSVLIGWIGIEPMLFGDHFGDSLFVRSEHDVLARLGESYRGEAAFIGHAFATPPLYLALAGVACAWYFYMVRPDLPALCARRLAPIHSVLVHKYGFDVLYEEVLARIGRGMGSLFWRIGDRILIDGLLVNGSARVVGWFSSLIRQLQTGFLYTYAFAMIIGLVALMSLFVFLRMQGHS